MATSRRWTRREVSRLGIAVVLTGCTGERTAPDETTGTAARTTIDHDRVVRVASLSPDARHEVETALDAGVYTSCEPLALLDEIDLQNDPVLKHDDELYEPVVAVGSGDTDGDCGDRYRIELRRITPHS